MKLSMPSLRLLIFIFFIFCANFVYSQQLSDEVSSKLSESDQKKLTKAENLAIKGDLQLSKANYPGDKQLLEMLSMGETKELRKYAGERIVASGFYKDANSGKFLIYEGNCNEFWKKFSGEKNPLEIIKQSQLKSIQKFNDAQEIRKVSEKKSKITERLPLIMEAEAKEKDAISLLQKVLFVYLNYPVNYDQSWFAPTDTTNKAVAEPAKSENKEIAPVITPTESIVPAIPVINPLPDTTSVKDKDSFQPKNDNIQSDTKKDTISKVIAVSVAPEQIVPKKIITSPIPNDYSAQKKDSTQHIKITGKEKDSNTMPGDSSLYMLANVNEDQIDQFNSFLQKKYPDKYENYIIDFQNIDYSNLQSLRNTWYQYRFGVEPSDSLTLLAKTSTVADSLAKDSTSQAVAISDVSVGIAKTDVTKQGVAKNSKQKGKTATKAKIQAKKSSGKTTEIASTEVNEPSVLPTKNTEIAATETNEPSLPTTVKTSEPIAKGFLFRVQVAASRVPINANVLKDIYGGSEQVIETNEDNWYKYTIGESNTYKQARQLIKQTNVPGAFVVAYLNGKRIRITPAVVTKKQIDENIITEGIQPDKIEFRVQLLASKKALDATLLKNIYNGSITIDTIDEDGWLKYSLLAGNKLSDALELIKSINIPGAFIVAYYNHQKLNLYTAIKLTKRN